MSININIIKKHRETLLGANNEEVGLEIKAKKMKYIFPSHHKDAIQNDNIMTVNICSETVAEFKHFGMRVRNQNGIHKDIKSRLH
jgi:hypothetical protein